MKKIITTGILAVCLLLIGASKGTAQTYNWELQ
ncbi:hypothetical protein BH11BAC7_BH11BAC7_12300 [soil metagenome]